MCGQRGTCSTVGTCGNASCVLHTQTVGCNCLVQGVLMCGQCGTCSTVSCCGNASCVLHSQNVSWLWLLGAGRADVWSARHWQDHAGQGCCHRVQNHLLQCLLINPGFQVQVGHAAYFGKGFVLHYILYQVQQNQFEIVFNSLH